MAVKTYISKFDDRRSWELHNEGTGKRIIVHVLNGQRTTVAYMKTARVKVDAFEYKTVWELYQDRFEDVGIAAEIGSENSIQYVNRLGVYGSPEAAFKGFHGGF